jgi:hypothetical protein
MLIGAESGQRVATTLTRSAITLMWIELPDRRWLHIAIAPLWITTTNVAILINSYCTQPAARTLDGGTTEDHTDCHHCDDSHKHQ